MLIFNLLSSLLFGEEASKEQKLEISEWKDTSKYSRKSQLDCVPVAKDHYKVSWWSSISLCGNQPKRMEHIWSIRVIAHDSNKSWTVSQENLKCFLGSALPGLSDTPCLADKVVEAEMRILGRYTSPLTGCSLVFHWVSSSRSGVSEMSTCASEFSGCHSAYWVGSKRGHLFCTF